MFSFILWRQVYNIVSVCVSFGGGRMLARTSLKRLAKNVVTTTTISTNQLQYLLTWDDQCRHVLMGDPRVTKGFRTKMV